ncbi:hypothetical protein [Flavobacterium sp.]|uniref:hypothetical protein n=1 Tax=Flavobacterium sp. TaxID=239 RepID=UPI002625A73C|nr:hypothetical protein [Flavobacterium sp.]
MKYENEKYYGKKKEFAIRYLKNNENSKIATCHLMLADKIIGDINETCYLGTWKNSIEILKTEIENGNFKIDKYKVFKDKTDVEIFDLIWDDSQDYRTLQVTIDETIDAYLISLIEKDGMLKFLWKGWREPCPENQIGKLYTLEVETESVIKTIENTLLEI